MKTFGFGAASAAVSPFAAVGQSSSAWSGWNNQRSATFEKRSLFDSVKPSKKEEKEKEDESDGDEEDDGDENGSASDLESQLENGEESGKSKIDMRERFSPLVVR
jgi:hypothetical protein